MRKPETWPVAAPDVQIAEPGQTKTCKHVHMYTYVHVYMCTCVHMLREVTWKRLLAQCHRLSVTTYVDVHA